MKRILLFLLAFTFLASPVWAMREIGYDDPIHPRINMVEPETMVQYSRIIADGGTVVDLYWMNQVISTLKAQGIYSSCKFLADANFAVKKDGSGAVSTLYDISGNNNDAVQATGANQPIWTAAQQNGKASIVFASANSQVLLTSLPANMKVDDYTFLASGKPTDISQTFISTGGADKDQYLSSDKANSYGTTGGDAANWASPTYNAYQVYISRRSVTDNNLAMIVNGTQVGIDTSLVTSAAGYDATSYLVIGQRASGGASYLNGGLGFSAIIIAAISTTQRQAMENLLNGYFQIY